MCQNDLGWTWAPFGAQYLHCLNWPSSLWLQAVIWWPALYSYWLNIESAIPFITVAKSKRHWQGVKSSAFGGKSQF